MNFQEQHDFFIKLIEEKELYSQSLVRSYVLTALSNNDDCLRSLKGNIFIERICEKCCEKCGKIKSIFEFYILESTMIFVLRSVCKECYNEKCKIRYKVNREAILSRQKKEYHANKAKYAARMKKYKEENREAVSAKDKEYCEKNKIAIAATKRVYYLRRKQRKIAA